MTGSRKAITKSMGAATTSLKSPSAQRKRAKLLEYVLDGNDAEFLLEQVANGKFKIRVGQVWKMPKVRGKSYLLIDLDNCDRRPLYENIRKRLRKCGVRPLRIRFRPSPSGTGFHGVVLIAGTFTRFERIALQAILESDADREAQNFRRAKLALPEWGENWNVLFK